MQCTTVSPRSIGITYLCIAIVFAAVGTVASNILRLEALTSAQIVLYASNISVYNLLITVHGLVMVFWFIMPTLFGGFGNVILPLALGVSDVSYPRFNNVSLLLLPLSLALVVSGLAQEYVQGPGWTLYAPLSLTGAMVCYSGLVLVLIGLIIVGNSSTLTSLNFLMTTAVQKTVGVTYATVSVCVIAMVITGILLLLVLPVLLCLIVLAIGDITYNSCFFDEAFGADPVFFQHLFWIFGHPEVYIIILPAFGLCSMCLSGTGITSTQAPLYGQQSMILATCCIAVLGSCVWAHHMFAAGIAGDTKAYFTVVTLMIALPTGTKIFNWSITY